MTGAVVAIAVNGQGVAALDQEAGGHRVQRVPKGEKRGRVHSSTVTVAVLRASAETRERPDGDFSIEWFSGSGAGGQHRNKHMNSARITHRPTGLVRSAQTRSRETSRREAMTALNAALDEMDQAQRAGKANEVRSAQIGSGMRADKKRTFRFQDGLVKDHENGRQASTVAVMGGRMDLLWV